MVREEQPQATATGNLRDEWTQRFAHSSLADDVSRQLTERYPLTIRYTSERGIHLIARRALHRGELILRECPVALALEQNYHARYCGICAALLTADDVERHRKRSNGAATGTAVDVESIYDPHSTLCEECSANNALVDLNNILARLGIHLKHNSTTGDHNKSRSSNHHPRGTTTVDDLGLYRMFFRLMFDYAGARQLAWDEDEVVALSVDHVQWLAWDRMGLSDEVEHDIQTVAQLINDIQAVPSSTSSSTSGAFYNDKDNTNNYDNRTNPQVTAMTTLFRNMICNQHVVMDDSGRQEIGRALYPLAALFNHSCQPNVHWHASSTTQGLIECHATADIPAGTELCIAYMNPQRLQAMPVLERRAVLFREQHFLCGCALCRGWCNRCAKESGKQCARCRQVWYCSADCQRQDWSVHKIMCALVRPASQKVVSE